ncbi:hypothetical protein Tco_1346864 [Tanacetum coccineum]
MLTRASNSELVEPLVEPERTLNRKLCRRNKRVPFERRDEQPAQPRIVYLPILDINYFRYFLDILENYNPINDEPMWAADRVVASTPGSAITIPKTANEFTIKGSNNYDTNKIMARMDAMTMKMDAQYKELQSRSNNSNPDCNDDDILMSREEEAKFMQTFQCTRFTMITATVTQIAIIDTFMDLKTKLKTTTKNHQASIQNFEAKFDRFADNQSSRPSGSLPSSTQPNPKGSSSKPYQPPKTRNEHVNVVFTQIGKSYDPPTNLNDRQNDYENPINFDSDDEEDESTPHLKL